ncbi:DUF3389 domain-containing protein [Photobacterium leiognathi]|uniref:DUF3389 domain-containing protein n=1 Tax=Photobacterium leiognathi subsp. mandapamensis TaxID=48408 RepID=A0A2T3KTQ1_PHOLD|nr:DUF3389 domain-containing protein [Photobacterium leiognathi]MCG3886208.1 DUF3389 domain-containing protein [Photobacterium leiognathi]PSV01369.1 DUF3389 domain-containing protein [Photobacterium leiognathi subsp. mandapamensis]PSV10027.1 DUF3389 domain-containing protein [Photobacterium leiognathi subsp. mandapamensis]PSW44668.1 DUF3389 domain-containing protein [Photobacterium leiognathi subsp. mandapamensis]PSW55156.1 DUF3389 domain-containing protein [Photobacterium leiognathi subsp. ma
MIIEFEQGKIIATQHEVVVRINGNARINLQAQIDELTLIAGANVVTAVGSGINWSVKLDSNEQLQLLADEIGIAITCY